jgi:hypothetical protein
MAEDHKPLDIVLLNVGDLCGPESEKIRLIAPDGAEHVFDLVDAMPGRILLNETNKDVVVTTLESWSSL